MNYNLIKTGSFEKSQGEFQILVLPEYRSALQGIEDFAYLQIVWWFDRCDTKESRTKLCETKPYMPSLDRVENPMMPAWCSNWPVNVETSGDFDWEGEFNF